MPRVTREKNLSLITGGARSGKSTEAETLAKRSGLPVIYVATVQLTVDDTEMLERIERHRRRRPSEWRTMEVPHGLESAIRSLPTKCLVLIDCLGVYVANRLLHGLSEGEDPYQREASILAEMGFVLKSIQHRSDLEFIAVTNEVGWGIVPDNALSRAYRDLLGTVNQLFAASAREVFLICAGQRLQIK